MEVAFFMSPRAETAMCGYLLYGRPDSEIYKGCDSFAYAFCDPVETGRDWLAENLWRYEAATEFWPRDTAEEYRLLARRTNMETTCLYCEIIREGISLPEPPAACRLLGYDVSWSAGDFYSAIFHEILPVPDHPLRRCLNPNGLFDTETQAQAFLRSGAIIERGDFAVVRVYAVSEYTVPFL